MLDGSFRKVALWGVWLIVGVVLAGCKEHSSQSFTAHEANYFHMSDTLDNVTVVDILNPWKEGERLARYYLVKDSGQVTPSDGIRIQIPVQRIATSSAPQVGFLNALGQERRIVACTTPHQLYHCPPQPIADIGEDIRLNNEALLKVDADVLLFSCYSDKIPEIERLQSLGINVVMMVEWMEQDPLSRADWVRLIGKLVGEEQQADSLMQVVRTQYELQQKEGAKHQKKVSVVPGMAFRGTWYVPSGSTYMGKLLLDAGADYKYAEMKTEGSIPLSIEQAICDFAQADVWVGCGVKSMTELRQIDDKHTWIRAYEQGRVYHFSERCTSGGGNDFWEMGVVRPDILLRDIQWALYPEDFSTEYKPMFIGKLGS